MIPAGSGLPDGLQAAEEDSPVTHSDLTPSSESGDRVRAAREGGRAHGQGGSVTSALREEQKESRKGGGEGWASMACAMGSQRKGKRCHRHPHESLLAPASPHPQLCLTSALGLRSFYNDSFPFCLAEAPARGLPAPAPGTLPRAFTPPNTEILHLPGCAMRATHLISFLNTQ